MDSVWLSIISLLVAFGSFLISLIALCVTIKDTRFKMQNYIFDNISPISVFLSDIYVILSNKKKLIGDVMDIKNAEKELITGFHKLYAFGKTNKYNYLCEFSTINAGNLNESTKCFAYLLFLLEDDYMTFREEKIGKTITAKEEQYLCETTDSFRAFIDIASSYTLSVLLNKRPNENTLDSYYKDLSNRFRKRG